ncbi:hypothetical protein Tco_0260425 [Tanacetum coccineum]
MTSSSKTNSPNYIRKTTRIRIKSPTYVNLESSSEEHNNERRPYPPLRNKDLSPPQASSKSTSRSSTYQTISSSLSESPAPTHVAPLPKLRIIIPMNLEPQKLPLQQTPPNNSHVSNMDNWPPGPINLSPPPRFPHSPLGFEHPPPPLALFVNINKICTTIRKPPKLGKPTTTKPSQQHLGFCKSK